MPQHRNPGSYPGAMAAQPNLERGVELFNAGRYWEAHEAWEQEWTLDRHGPDRGFYKGLIQVAAGCLHHSRGNRSGAVTKWRGGAALLRPYLPRHHGIDLVALLTATEACLAAVERTGEHGVPPPPLPRIAVASG